VANQASVSSITRASTILGALEAVRNIHAGILAALVFVTTAVLFALFGYLATGAGGGVLVAALGGLLVFLTSVYGASAIGYMLMSDAKGAPSLSMIEAVLLSLRTTHRWLAVMLLALLVFVAFAVVLLLILVVCKIPFLGPVLYAVVFPVAVLATAAFLAAMYFVVMPLSFPAVWAGDTTMQAVAKLWAIVRQRLVQVVVLVLLLALLCFVIGGIISLLTFGGLAVVGALSAALLPTGSGIGGLMSGMMMGAGGHVVAGAIGVAIVFAIVTIVPFLILLRGYCLIYLEVIQGIDFSAAEAELKARMENVQRQAREAQERAREKMQSAPTPPAPPPVPPSAAPAAPAAGIGAAPAAAKCPQCGAAVTADDAFCGGCGARLR
jgi:hypothetical protein